MENIIDDMISAAYRHNNFEMVTQAYKIMLKFATTINCPSNWRTIGKMMLEKYQDNQWIVENCRLYEFEE